MRDPLYRAATRADIPALAELFAAARDDLARRQGLPTRPEPAVESEPRFEHVLATGVFRLAEIAGEIVALACAIMRDDIWFLSGFWGRPDSQNLGIGGPLLRQVWAAGEAAGCRTFCVWASSDPTALAAYMKLGMLPGYPVLHFAASADNLHLSSAAGALRPATRHDLPRLGAVDAEIRGTPRLEDHRWLLGRSGAECWLLERAGQAAAYAYCSGGRVGPAAWLDPGDAGSVLSFALAQAASGGGRVSASLPGSNHAALRLALSAGLHLMGHNHFLSTRPLGHPEQYIPHGPLIY